MSHADKMPVIAPRVVVELECLQVSCDKLRAMLYGLSIAIEDGGLKDLQSISGAMWAAAKSLDEISTGLDLLCTSEGGNHG